MTSPCGFLCDRTRRDREMVRELNKGSVKLGQQSKIMVTPLSRPLSSLLVSHPLEGLVGDVSAAVGNNTDFV